MRRRYKHIGKHTCTIESTQLWPLLSPRANFLQRWIRSLRKSALPSYMHPASKHQFKTMYAMRSEKERMIYFCNPFVIHPHSVLALVRSMLICGVMHAYFGIESFRLYFRMYDEITHTTIISRLVVLGLMLSRLLCGYRDAYGDVELDLSCTALTYAKHYLWIDLLEIGRIFFAFIPNACACLWLNFVIFHLFVVISMKRALFYSRYLGVFLKIVFNLKERTRKFGAFLVFNMLCLHYITCFHFGLGYLMSIFAGNKNNDKTMDLSANVHHYILTLHRVSMMFFRSTPNFLKEDKPHYDLIECFTKIPLFFLHVYIIVFVVAAAKNSNAALIKYSYMRNNVLNFLKTYNIAGKLHFKILEHYEHKFQYKYFDEAFIIENLSTHLQYECRLHSCSHLLINSTAFRGLTKAIVGRIVASLEPAVYLANDIVFQWSDHFDSLYFISYGTVALYNEKGKELMHLEDGGILGTLGYYSGNYQYTVTAVTITELYRWHANDIAEIALLCPDLAITLKVMGKKFMGGVYKQNEFKTKLEGVVQEARELRQPVDTDNAD